MDYCVKTVLVGLGLFKGRRNQDFIKPHQEIRTKWEVACVAAPKGQDADVARRPLLIAKIPESQSRSILGVKGGF